MKPSTELFPKQVVNKFKECLRTLKNVSKQYAVVYEKIEETLNTEEHAIWLKEEARLTREEISAISYLEKYAQKVGLDIILYAVSPILSRKFNMFEKEREIRQKVDGNPYDYLFMKKRLIYDDNGEPVYGDDEI